MNGDNKSFLMSLKQAFSGNLKIIMIDRGKHIPCVLCPTCFSADVAAFCKVSHE